MSIWELPSASVLQEQWICKSALFSQLCLTLVKLAGKLYDRDEDPEDNQEARAIRLELARLRYLPYQGRPDFLQETLPDKGRLYRQFDGEVVTLLDYAETLFQQWQSNGSILTQTFKEQFLREIKRVGLKQIRIACRSSDKQLFLQLLAGQVVLEDYHFITGIESYRKSQKFEVLFRVGSFRLEGMQKIATAILTAPKYRKLVRFCWERTMDEDGIAVDLVTPDIDYLKIMSVTRRTVDDDSIAHVLIDTERLDQLLSKEVSDRSLVDNSPVSCLRFVLSDRKAVLFRRGHSLLVYRDKADERAVFSLKARDLREGDYWIESDVEVDLGKEEVNPADYPMAKIWKSALSALYQRTPNQCVMLMEGAGIALKDLHTAAKNWGRFYKYRVNAPQKQVYFRALIEQVLSQSIWQGVPLADPSKSVSDNAWSELTRYKGQMIEDGQLGHQIVAEQLQNELAKALRLYRNSFITLEDSHPFVLPEETGLIGKVLFRKVIRVDTSFTAPEDVLSKVMDIEFSEQFETNQED